MLKYIKTLYKHYLVEFHLLPTAVSLTTISLLMNVYHMCQRNGHLWFEHLQLVSWLLVLLSLNPFFTQTPKWFSWNRPMSFLCPEIFNVRGYNTVWFICMTVSKKNKTTGTKKEICGYQRFGVRGRCDYKEVVQKNSYWDYSSGYTNL